MTFKRLTNLKFLKYVFWKFGHFAWKRIIPFVENSKVLFNPGINCLKRNRTTGVRIRQVRCFFYSACYQLRHIYVLG